MESLRTVQCPYCKEQVLEGAVKCKHCGSALNLQVLAHKQKGKLTFVGGLGCAMGLLILGIGLFAVPPNSEAKAIAIGTGIGFFLISYLFCRR